MYTSYLYYIFTAYLLCLTIILAVVLYACETWSFTLREERRLRMSENGMLRRIFGPKRDKVTGERRNLHNKELNDLYCSSDVFQVIQPGIIRWAGHVARRGREQVHTGFWRGEMRKKEHLEDLSIEGRVILKWIFKNVGWEGVDFIGLAQDRDRWRDLVNTVMNFRVP